MARLDRGITQQARKQLGLITFQQLADHACTRSQRRGLVRSGVLVPEQPRVLRIAGAERTWRQQALAACLSAGEGAVLSDDAAATSWHFPRAADPAVDHTPIDLAVPDRRSLAGVVARIHRPSALASADTTRLGPHPITTRARTIVDCAGHWEARRLEEAVDALVRDGKVSRAALRRCAVALQARGRRGPAAVLALLDRGIGGPGRPESWLEAEYLRVTSAAGLPAPEPQVRIRHEAGTARVDFVYADQRLVVEVDGHGTHSTRRERQADAERHAHLVAAGWQVLHFTYEDLTERPDYVVTMVARFLACATDK